MTTKSDNERAILGVYEELKGVLASLQDASSWFDDEGFTRHVNGIVDRASVICKEIEDINSYKLDVDHVGNRGPIVHTTQAKAKLNAIIGRLRGTYDLEHSQASVNAGHTFIQNQTQSQTQHLSLVLDLHERIISEIPKHEEGSKERTFLENLKETLPTIKDTMGIFSLALKIGSDLGLTPGAIKGLLGL